MASLTFEASLPHPDDTDKLGARLADAVSKEAGAVAGHGDDPDLAVFHV